MLVRPINIKDAAFVAENMREWDRREIFATHWRDEGPFGVARDAVACGDFGWILGRDKPIATIGAYPMHPHVWSVYMFATDDFRQIRISATKFARRVIIPALVAADFRRAQCLSMEGHTDSHRWLEALGAKRESVLREYGRDGEDFVMFSLSRDDVHVSS